MASEAGQRHIAVGMAHGAASIKAIMLATHSAMVILSKCNSDEPSKAVLSAIAM